MLVPEQQKIEEAVNVDGIVGQSHFPATKHVWLRGKFLEVVHGHFAVRVPVTRQSKDKDGPIPALAFELSRRLTPGTPTIDASRDKVVALPGMAGINRPTGDKLASPTFDAMVERHVQGERPYEIAVNASYLQTIARAFGTEKLVLKFSGHPHHVVLVEPASDKLEGEAILMPLESDMAPVRPVPDSEGEPEQPAEEQTTIDAPTERGEADGKDASPDPTG